MKTLVVGDIQGCYDELMQLLRLADFNPTTDKLICLGDVVNRGPKSLATLRFLSRLPNCEITLGNHDLHLLHAYYIANKPMPKDSITEIINADDADILCGWLRRQNFMLYLEEHNLTLSHAGIYPKWSLIQALSYAKQLKDIFSHGDYTSLLSNFYQHNNVIPASASNLFNLLCFTMMRYLSNKGELVIKINADQKQYLPWFTLASKKHLEQKVIFGHWSALSGKTGDNNYLCLDTGCVWGNKLTAIELSSWQYFSVPSKYTKFLKT